MFSLMALSVVIAGPIVFITCARTSNKSRNAGDDGGKQKHRREQANLVAGHGA